MILPALVVSGGRPQATFREIRTSSTDAFVYTFPGVDFGPPSPRRKIVAAAMVGTGEPWAVAIGGVTATKIARSFWIADVPSGTSGDVYLDGSYSAIAWPNASIAVWSVERLLSSTAVDSKRWPNDYPLPFNLNMNSRGVALGFAFGVVGSSSITWLGLSEDAEIAHEVTRISCASYQAEGPEARSISGTTVSAGDIYTPSIFTVSLR